jgi:hypothetical protein
MVEQIEGHGGMKRLPQHRSASKKQRQTSSRTSSKEQQRERRNNYASVARVNMEANHMTPCLGGNLAVFSGVLRTPVGSDNGSFANTVAILGPQFGFAESTSFSRDVFKIVPCGSEDVGNFKFNR